VSRVIEDWLAEGAPDKPRIGALLREHEFPLIEKDGVTFVFHGRADEIRLRHWIFGLPSSQPFHRIENSDLWHLTVDIPPCSRVEYKIERIVGGNRKWLMDPLNSRVAKDPFGANSVCYGRGYETPPWTLSDPEARCGEMDALVVPSERFGQQRTVRIYLPARFRRRRRYPLLVVHDGDDYLRYANLQVVLDNLIHRQEIPPMIVALSRPVARLEEYAADEAHAGHLVEELLPAVEKAFPIGTRPADRVLMGASFGAVAALHTAWKHPGVFGGLLLQSGSFAFADIGEHGRGPSFDPVAEFINAFRADPGRPAEKVFVSCGIHESLIYENRSLVPRLQETGMSLRYVEARDGHNWDNWRDRLREGLSWLLPGPLWMIYE